MMNIPFGGMPNRQKSNPLMSIKSMQPIQQVALSIPYDPEQFVMSLLNSGKLSQADFNQMDMWAKEFLNNQR